MGTFRITVNGVVVAKRLWPFLSLKGWLCNLPFSSLPTLQKGTVKESLLKGTNQYNWPPGPNLPKSVAYLTGIFLLLFTK